MPRECRPTAAGLYHVITTSTKPDEFFRDGLDRMEFIALLEQATQRFKSKCISLCLMTTHYHSIFDVPESSLSVGMKWLNWKYAHAFNKRHGRRGHHVGARFAAIPILSEKQLLRTYRYVARNPVRAGISQRPQSWPWSSYASAVGLAHGFGFVDATIVLERFGERREIAIERLRGFVEADAD